MRYVFFQMFYIVTICVCLTPGKSLAEPVETDPLPSKTAQQAFYPPPDEYDWIQLTSGEWLKGEFNVLYNYRIEFDSDELELLNLDWEDIEKIRNNRVTSVHFDDDTTVVGVLKMEDDKISIQTNDQVLTFNRNEVVSIAAGGKKERNFWTAKVTLGLNIRQGNSDLVEYNLVANAKRRTAESQFLLDYLGSVNRTQGVETSNSQRLSGSYDILKSRKFFWRTLFGEYFRDPFQNIRNRLNLGTGFGYRIIKTSKAEWFVTSGIGSQFIEYVSVQPEQNIKNTSPSLFGGTRFDIELTNAIDIDGSYEFQLVDEESGTFTHHAIVSLSSEITNSLDFDVSFVWDRIKDPLPREDSTIPEKDDLRLILGLAYDL